MLSLRSEDKIRARRHDMKRGPTTSEDSRRRRAGETLKLRTDKREELMAKRRRDLTPELGMGAEMMEVVTQRVRFGLFLKFLEGRLLLTLPIPLI